MDDHLPIDHSPPSDYLLPAEIIEHDRKLAEEVSAKSWELMQLRWHWTLDESNPKRVSIREYAREVNRSETTIRRDAHAYELRKREGGTVRSVDDARELARMGAEKAKATEMIADRYGSTIETARKKHHLKIKELRDRARERAEAEGTSFEDEVDAALEEMTEKFRMPTPERPEKNGRANQVGAYLALMSRILRDLRKAVHEGPTVVYWLGEQQPDFIERADDARALATTLADVLRGGQGMTEMAVLGTAEDVDDYDYDTGDEAVAEKSGRLIARQSIG